MLSTAARLARSNDERSLLEELRSLEENLWRLLLAGEKNTKELVTQQQAMLAMQKKCDLTEIENAIYRNEPKSSVLPFDTCLKAVLSGHERCDV